MFFVLDVWFVFWNLKWKFLELEVDIGLIVFVSCVVNKYILEEIWINVIWCKDRLWLLRRYGKCIMLIR